MSNRFNIWKTCKKKIFVKVNSDIGVAYFIHNLEYQVSFITVKLIFHNEYTERRQEKENKAEIASSVKNLCFIEIRKLYHSLTQMLKFKHTKYLMDTKKFGKAIDTMIGTSGSTEARLSITTFSHRNTQN